jgi:hypothetical protein
MTSINPEQAMLLKTYNSIQDTYRSSKQLIATLHSSIVFNSKCVVRKVLPPNLEIHLSPYTWPKGLDKSLSDNSDNYIPTSPDGHGSNSLAFLSGDGGHSVPGFDGRVISTDCVRPHSHGAVARQ